MRYLVLCPTSLSFSRFCPTCSAILVFAPLRSIHFRLSPNGALPLGKPPMGMKVEGKGKATAPVEVFDD